MNWKYTLVAIEPTIHFASKMSFFCNMAVSRKSTFLTFEAKCICHRVAALHRENSWSTTLQMNFSWKWQQDAFTSGTHLRLGPDCLGPNMLIHWGRDKMVTILQKTFLNGFSWLKMSEFWLKFYSFMFPKFHLTINQPGFYTEDHLLVKSNLICPSDKLSWQPGCPVLHINIQGNFCISHGNVSLDNLPENLV